VSQGELFFQFQFYFNVILHLKWIRKSILFSRFCFLVFFAISSWLPRSVEATATLYFKELYFTEAGCTGTRSVIGGPKRIGECLKKAPESQDAKYKKYMECSTTTATVKYFKDEGCTTPTQSFDHEEELQLDNCVGNPTFGAASTKKFVCEEAGDDFFFGTLLQRGRNYGWIKPNKFGKLPAEVQTKIKEMVKKKQAVVKKNGSDNDVFSQSVLFVHMSDVEEGIKVSAGDKVKFKVYTDSEGAGAHEVTSA